MPSSNPILCGSLAGRPGNFGVAMHTAAYRALDLPYAYVAFGTDDTAGAVAAMRALGIRGLGVTTPHKLRIAPLLDDIDPDARAIGAVNTVVNDDGRLTGYNVDWIGAVRAVGEVMDPAGAAAAVIGAGGHVAVIYGLVRAGATVTLFNRNEAVGESVARALGARFGGPPAAAVAAAPAFDLLVHATSVGFHAPEATLLPAAALHADAVIFDIVAQPPVTRLLREAQARGCRTISGVRMQLHQAARQFELYTGRTPDLAVMEQALLAAMKTS